MFWQTTMLYEVVNHLDCLLLVALFQSAEKSVRERFHVMSSVTCLELEKGFPGRRTNAVLVQHARDMRSASRQFHLVPVQASDFIGQPFTFRFSCLHIDTPVLAASACRVDLRMATRSSSRVSPTLLTRVNRDARHTDFTPSSSRNAD